jgi:hypothetical protein
MKFFYPRWDLWIGLLACAGLIGCSSSGLDVERVSGTVTLDGKSIEGAIVTFSPDAPKGVVASGITDAEGRFQLNANTGGAAPGAGTPSGSYKVKIVKIETLPPVEITDDYDPSITEAATRKAKKPKHIIPEAYGTTETSGLTATVNKGANDFSFELDSKFKGT